MLDLVAWEGDIATGNIHACFMQLYFHGTDGIDVKKERCGNTNYSCSCFRVLTDPLYKKVRLGGTPVMFYQSFSAY